MKLLTLGAKCKRPLIVLQQVPNVRLYSHIFVHTDIFIRLHPHLQFRLVEGDTIFCTGYYAYLSVFSYMSAVCGDFAPSLYLPAPEFLHIDAKTVSAQILSEMNVWVYEMHILIKGEKNNPT